MLFVLIYDYLLLMLLFPNFLLLKLILKGMFVQSYSLPRQNRLEINNLYLGFFPLFEIIQLDPKIDHKCLHKSNP